MAANWIYDAIFYEIYPQSFYDSNGDGIGDIKGMCEKLPYIKDLGCNALWINPCFDSSFKDAGYDVRDYKKIAPRYGTNEDMKEFLILAHSLGIRVLLDLVPGHTGEDHPWFQESAKNEKNEFSGRYIWTGEPLENGDGMPFIGGEYPRFSAYIVNFFKCQPALNYGYAEIRRSWQQPIDSSDALATREAMKDIMRFWLDMGCDGFRVDMADSLVKNDGPKKEGTSEVWRDITGTIHREYPNAALISEWNCPELSLNCGFDMDFYLNWDGNGYSSMMRNYRLDAEKKSYVDTGSYFSKNSGSDVSLFLEDYLPQYEKSKGKGLWCLITCNHDTPRPSATLTDRERRLAFAWIFTMPGAPFLYYGDEIGMEYRLLPSKEGGYYRTGSRTPMQWTTGKNLGFSDAPSESLYLPVESHDKHTIESQLADETSLLNFMKKLIAFRKSQPDLRADVSFEIFSANPGSRLFAYKRGSLLIAINPSANPISLPLDRNYKVLFTVGDVDVTQKESPILTLGEQSFVVLR